MPSLKLLSDLPVGGNSLPFHIHDYISLPEASQNFLSHAIAEGTPLARTVRLEMTGEIKLKKWLPFTATQIVRADRGFVWSAKVKTGFAYIKGSDQFIDGVGEMRWKLLGLIPVMSGTGPDISRSASDRYAMERILLPSALCRPEVRWTSQNGNASAEAPGIAKITLGLDPNGSVKFVSMLRWGNPDGGAFALAPFGGYTDAEATWGGYTIPTQLRIGWHAGTDRFEEGEFFRANITSAEFR